MSNYTEFEIIVVGGGHAGTTKRRWLLRAWGTKRFCSRTDIETIGQMSVALHPLVASGKVIWSRKSMLWVVPWGWLPMKRHTVSHPQLQQRPCRQTTRAQADRVLYRQAIRKRIENQPNLWVMQQAVDDLILERHRVMGVITAAQHQNPCTRGDIDCRHHSLRGWRILAKPISRQVERRSAIHNAGAKTARNGISGRATENRHATPY